MFSTVFNDCRNVVRNRLVSESVDAFLEWFRGGRITALFFDKLGPLLVVVVLDSALVVLDELLECELVFF